MSFFGQQTNSQQQGTGFGGFGANNNTTPSTGFGQPPQNTGFGTSSNNAGGGLFGGTTTGFGTGGTGFGAANTANNAFGANRPAFGANTTTSSGGIFGGNTTTAGSSTGFGGFGAQAANTSGGLFGGASKAPFGGTTTGPGLFGGSSTGTGFGAANQQPVSVFGAPPSSALSSTTQESQGTGSTPFNAHIEKEAGMNTSNHYQSISFMQPYKNFSFEELRVADYNQGRRYGNASGQAGAFGANTGFGGFGQQQNTASPFGTTTGASGGGLFGSQPTSNASPFGGTQTAGTGFGAANAGTGLFGAAPKPTTGLFGTTPATSAQPTGGIFGTAPQTGFGSSNTTGFGTGAATGGGLFGQPKPGLFGNPGNQGGFGSGGATNTGLFGSGQQNTTPFGAAPQQQQQQQQVPASNPFGGFGNNQTQQQTGNAAPFGGFGAAPQEQPKPGLFSSAPAAGAGGGPFGANNQQNNQQQPATSSLFAGNTNNQTGTSSLFSQKPAPTGTSLFGTNPANTGNNPGGGLFGSTFNNNSGQNQQPQSTGLFSSLNNQTAQPPKPGGLFGGSAMNTGSSLFNTNNNQQSSLFANPGSGNQQQSSSLFSSNNNTGQATNFNNSQTQPNALQAPQAQFATLESLPYGSASIFYGLPPSPHVSVGPVATPITTQQKMKRSAILPQYRINPNQASRLVTPQKRGFGFSYSSYGTPSSVSSTQSTPGSLLFSSVGRGLGKSFSTSNLRRTFDNDGESILSPGAFSANSTRMSGTGSLKKLTIDRSLRNDLFGSPTVAALPSPEKPDQFRQSGILKKKVSFDTGTVGGNGNSQENTDNGTRGPVDQDTTNGEGPSVQEQGFLRSSNRGHARSKLNGTAFEQPEIEQVKGNELAIVPEDSPAEVSNGPSNRQTVPTSHNDPLPGAYYMHPSRQELERMSADERKHVSGFSVGREGCGYVTFDHPVDLSLAPLDDIFEKLVVIEIRSLTVYPESSLKPSLGQGLNVPSTIYLENSWPRTKDRKTPIYDKSGPRFNKHVDRLRKVSGTEFVRYEKDTGIWVFKVPHFTTYALDFDDDESEADGLNTSVLTEVVDTPTPKSRHLFAGHTPRPISSAHQSSSAHVSSFLSGEQSFTNSSPDDTFQFRKKKILPGTFDTAASAEAPEPEDAQSNEEDSFYDRSTESHSESGVDEPSEIQEPDGDMEGRMLVVHEDDDMEMAGSFPPGDLDNATADSSEGIIGPILRFMGQDEVDGTPKKLIFNQNGDWAEELQRTISPRKQDRQALRQNQSLVLEDLIIDRGDTPKAAPKMNGTGNQLKTSIDLMNSLFGEEQARRKGLGVKKAKAKGFQWPYSKKSKTHEDDEENMNEADQQFHQSYKPHWGPETTLLYAMPSKVNLIQSQSSQTTSLLVDQKGTFVSERKDIRFAKFAITSPLIPTTLIKQRRHTKYNTDIKVPSAEFRPLKFREMAAGVDQSDSEYFVWELAAILFDEPESDTAMGALPADKTQFEQLIRKENLIQMWQRICQPSARKAALEARNHEERAIAQLSANNIVQACDELLQGKDYRLAILVSQICGDRVMREDLTGQIEAWRKLNVLSEIAEPIRALYELLAGNVCVCEGKKGPAEDRARTFAISERFNLDWKRAFGLRLWYAILSEEPIHVAVQKYATDLETHEKRKPLPWFLEDQARVLWEDPNADQREDILWGLLKLFTSSRTGANIPISSIVTPHNTTGNPVDSRLSFQLYHALSLHFPSAINNALGDQLALDFAANLDSAGEWVWAIFILLHISNPGQRQSSIQSLLSIHAAEIIPDDTSQESNAYVTLTIEFGIPEEWVWESKALHARSVTQNHVDEVHFLLLAHNWEEAHDTLCRVVAPRAIIESDHDTLRQLLIAFQGEGREHVADWGLGGGVYEDFVALVLGLDVEQDGRMRRADRSESGKLAILNRLLSALPVMVQEHVGAMALDETVAIKEMSAIVASAAVGLKGIESRRILQLPLGEQGGFGSMLLTLGLGYYESVMGGGGEILR